MRRLCASLVVLWLLPGGAAAQDALAWKLRPGESFFAERHFTRQESVEVNERQFRQESVTTWLVRLDVKEQTPKGYALQAVLEDVRHKVIGAAGKDGLDDRLAEKMRGAAFALTVTPSGRIVDFTGYDEFLKKVAGDQADRAKVLRATLPESAMREAFGDLFGRLPEQPVKAGDTWTSEEVEPIPFFGALHSEFRYEYKGAEGPERRVSYTVQTRFAKPRADELVRVVKGEVRGEQGKGSFAFDAAKGRLSRHERSMTVRGNLVLETAGRQTPVRFVSENRLRVRILDRDPGK